MDNSRCRSFFLKPTQTFHRQYEALRAFFVEGQPLKEVARQWGYCYSALRSMVCRFRAQVQAGQLPPFFPNLS
jgi:hypothetical protein